MASQLTTQWGWVPQDTQHSFGFLFVLSPLISMLTNITNIQSIFCSKKFFGKIQKICFSNVNILISNFQSRKASCNKILGSQVVIGCLFLETFSFNPKSWILSQLNALSHYILCQEPPKNISPLSLKYFIPPWHPTKLLNPLIKGGEGGRNYHPLSENRDFSGTNSLLDLRPV